MTTRHSIEAAILGAILLQENTMAMVCDILTDRNFTGVLGTYTTANGQEVQLTNGTLYQTMLCMYPAQAIDILTVLRQLQKNHNITDPKLPNSIAQLTETVCSNHNAQQHALILVQESIADLLDNWINTKVQEASNIVAQITEADENTPALLEREKDFIASRQRLRLIPDVFDRVEALRNFFTAYGYTQELEELNQIAANINKRTRAIREKRYTSNIVRSLRHMGHKTNNGDLIDQLINTILKLTEDKASPKLTHHINQLEVLA